MIILQVMFSRGSGGLERVFTDHAELLAERGHTVHCVILKRAGYAQELASLARRSRGMVVVHTINADTWRRLLLPLRLWLLLQQIRPDVMLGHGAKVITHLSLMRPRCVPLLAITHNDSPRLMWATHLIALTRQMRSLFEQRGFAASRIAQIPNPLPIHACAQQLTEQRVTGQPAVIGTLSRLVPKKGIDLFLRAFRVAIDNGLSATAVIGGDGPERPALEALSRSLQLQDRVTFTGWIADPGSFYSGLDWCCIPSREEPFGLVALESFAYGVPILAAAVGGLNEIVADGINGILFAAGNVNALARALLSTQAQPQCGDALRQAAYLCVEQYRPECIGAAIENALLAAIVDLHGKLLPQAAG